MCVQWYHTNGGNAYSTIFNFIQFRLRKTTYLAVNLAAQDGNNLKSKVKKNKPRTTDELKAAI